MNLWCTCDMSLFGIAIKPKPTLVGPSFRGHRLSLGAKRLLGKNRSWAISQIQIVRNPTCVFGVVSCKVYTTLHIEKTPFESIVQGTGRQLALNDTKPKIREISNCVKKGDGASPPGDWMAYSWFQWSVGSWAFPETWEHFTNAKTATRLNPTPCWQTECRANVETKCYHGFAEVAFYVLPIRWLVMIVK